MPCRQPVARMEKDAAGRATGEPPLRSIEAHLAIPTASRQERAPIRVPAQMRR